MAVDVSKLVVGDRLTQAPNDEWYYTVVSFRIPNNDVNITGIDPNANEFISRRLSCNDLYWWVGIPKRPNSTNIVFPSINPIVDAPKSKLLDMYNKGILCTTFPTLTPIQCAALTVLVLAP